MLTGKVVWFSGEKSYGFIKPDDGSPDIFVHFSSILMDGYKTLKPEAKVSYDVEISERSGKPQAANVTPID